MSRPLNPNSLYIFNTGTGTLAPAEVRRRHAIAAEHEAIFVYIQMPEAYRWWFAAPNLGEPFDRARVAAVQASITNFQGRG